MRPTTRRMSAVLTPGGTRTSTSARQWSGVRLILVPPPMTPALTVTDDRIVRRPAAEHGGGRRAGLVDAPEELLRHRPGHGLQLAQFRERLDDLEDRVPAVVRICVVAHLATHGQGEPDHPLLAEAHRGERAGLADDDGVGPQPGVVIDEVVGAPRAHRLRLHVGHAAAEDLAVDDVAAEGIALPAVAVAHGERVEMAVEDDRAARAAVGRGHHVDHPGPGLDHLGRITLALQVLDDAVRGGTSVTRRILAGSAHELAEEAEPLFLPLVDLFEDLVARVHGLLWIEGEVGSGPPAILGARRGRCKPKGLPPRREARPAPSERGMIRSARYRRAAHPAGERFSRIQRAFQFGFRFSAKARGPSTVSSERRIRSASV